MNAYVKREITIKSNRRYKQYLLVLSQHNNTGKWVVITLGRDEHNLELFRVRRL